MLSSYYWWFRVWLIFMIMTGNSNKSRLWKHKTNITRNSNQQELIIIIKSINLIYVNTGWYKICVNALHDKLNKSSVGYVSSQVATVLKIFIINKTESFELVSTQIIENEFRRVIWRSPGHGHPLELWIKIFSLAGIRLERMQHNVK